MNNTMHPYKQYKTKNSYCKYTWQEQPETQDLTQWKHNLKYPNGTARFRISET